MPSGTIHLQLQTWFTLSCLGRLCKVNSHRHVCASAPPVHLLSPCRCPLASATLIVIGPAPSQDWLSSALFFSLTPRHSSSTSNMTVSLTLQSDERFTSFQSDEESGMVHKWHFRHCVGLLYVDSRWGGCSAFGGGVFCPSANLGHPGYKVYFILKLLRCHRTHPCTCHPIYAFSRMNCTCLKLNARKHHPTLIFQSHRKPVKCSLFGWDPTVFIHSTHSNIV